MKSLRRAFGLAVATLVLLTTLTPNAALVSSAQDANTVTVDGSNIVSPVLKTATEHYTQTHPDTKIDIKISGTDAGFEKLCAGTLDIGMAARSITDQEVAACQSKNVNFVELVIGYNALVVAVNATSTVQCISIDQLNKLVSPGSTSVKNWNAVDATLGDLPITNIYTTGTESQSYRLADSLLAGEGLRPDLTKVDNIAAMSDKITGEIGGVGLMTAAEFATLSQTNKGLKTLKLKGSADCVDPTATNLEEARYPAAETLYLYANAASLDRKPVADFLQYMITGEGRTGIVVSGFLPASNTTFDRGQNYLNSRQTGRTFSRIQAVNIPASTAGTVTVDGSASVFTVIKAVVDAFKPHYDKITVNATAYGNEAGYRGLCANSLDVIGATRLPTDAEAEACQKANILTYNLPLGSNAVVLVANEKNTAACLTTDQIGKLFGKDSEGKVKKWSDVDASFPATDLLLITPTEGSAVTDLLLSKSIKAVAPLRRTDVTESDDAQYRAAGTQNVEGAVTYLTFTEYKASTAKVKLLQVNSGNGCVDATEDNIKSGKYALAQTQYFILNQNAFSRPEVKAFVWYLLSDDALAIIAKQGLVGTDVAAFTAARDVALAKFTEAGGSATVSAPGSATAEVPAPAATAAATDAATAAAATPAATSAAAATAAATTESVVPAAPVATAAATAAQ